MTGTRSARIEAKLYDDEYEFCLRIGELIELTEARDVGPQMLLYRLENGVWHPKDLIETIRFGLKGGGMDALEAKKLANHVVKEGYLIENLSVAVAILQAALVGVPDDMPEMPDEEPGEPKTSGTESST